MTKPLAILPALLAAISVGCAQTRSPSQFAAESIRQAIAAPQTSPITRKLPELKEIVARELDPQLLAPAPSISGSDYKFQFPDAELNRHLGIIVLRYSTVTIARQMTRALTPRKGYFGSSKILIHFSAVPLGPLLLIAYSESSGDDRILKALDALPAAFQKATTPDAPTWAEPQ